eukprot:3407175-Rhodomonas_salina.2
MKHKAPLSWYNVCYRVGWLQLVLRIPVVKEPVFGELFTVRIRLTSYLQVPAQPFVSATHCTANVGTQTLSALAMRTALVPDTALPKRVDLRNVVGPDTAWQMRRPYTPKSNTRNAVIEIPDIAQQMQTTRAGSKREFSYLDHHPEAFPHTLDLPGMGPVNFRARTKYALDMGRQQKV